VSTCHNGVYRDFGNLKGKVTMGRLIPAGGESPGIKSSLP
jgi:hypothetical protein